VKESEIWDRLGRVKIVGAHTILRARISSTPIRLITRSKTSSGSDVKPGQGRDDVIEDGDEDFKTRISIIAGFGMQSARPKWQMSDMSLVMIVRAGKTVGKEENEEKKEGREEIKGKAKGKEKEKGAKQLGKQRREWRTPEGTHQHTSRNGNMNTQPMPPRADP
jgi:hypothetical protein